jgi:DNA invertase Pin-like site-specific DNA recombinase
LEKKGENGQEGINSFSEFIRLGALIRSLYRIDRFRVFDYLFKVKASSALEIAKETGVSQPTIWRTFQDLERFSVVTITNKIAHPKSGRRS